MVIDSCSVAGSILVPAFLRELLDGGFYVAAHFLRQPVHLHLLRLLGGVRVG